MASAAPLFNADGTLTQGAEQMCKVLGVGGEVKNAWQFNDFFQKNLLRPKNAERWEPFESKMKLSDEQLDCIIEICGKLGMLSEVPPKTDDYDYILIFGSGTQLMRKSCEFLQKHLPRFASKNTRLGIFFLTGSRPLNERADPDDSRKILESLNLPATEEFAAKLIWTDTLECSCDFINVDPIDLHKGPGELKRANTGDTVTKLIQTERLTPGKMLAISNNPFIAFQHNVTSNLLANSGWFTGGGTLETVGSCIDVAEYANAFGKKHVVNILLDNVARCAYEEMRQIASAKAQSGGK
jgi:hypothetical protein